MILTLIALAHALPTENASYTADIAPWSAVDLTGIGTTFPTYGDDTDEDITLPFASGPRRLRRDGAESQEEERSRDEELPSSLGNPGPTSRRPPRRSPSCVSDAGCQAGAQAG